MSFYDVDNLTWEFIVGLCYFFCCMCFVAPPQEFVEAGLTIQNLFGKSLGVEHLNFVYYHIKRSTLTLVIHACIPLGYCLLLMFYQPSVYLLQLPSQSWPVRLYFIFSGSCVLVCLALSAWWHRNHWSSHPVAWQLSKMAEARSGWRSVASSLNIEFRRPDKFSTGLYSRRLHVTDSWLVQVTTYGLNIAHQSNIVLNLDESQEMAMTYVANDNITGSNTAPPAQYLRIMVKHVRGGANDFGIRLNATEYEDLKTKLQRPVLNARQIVIQQTQNDRFLFHFKAVVSQNHPFSMTDSQEVDTCIGCLQEPSGVKLVRLCEEGRGCEDCFCRPLWCLSCLGKWFASRQDQNRPDQWLAGQAPCPMCRAKFCVADICLLAGA